MTNKKILLSARHHRIYMPGCDLPPKTNIENVLSMVNTAHNTKKE